MQKWSRIKGSASTKKLFCFHFWDRTHICFQLLIKSSKQSLLAYLFITLPEIRFGNYQENHKNFLEYHELNKKIKKEKFKHQVHNIKMIDDLELLMCLWDPPLKHWSNKIGESAQNLEEKLYFSVSRCIVS